MFYFRYKRDQLHKQILVETKEKELVQADLKKLSEMLVKVNESICDKITAKTRLDEAVKDTEQAFTNLAKGSENLLKFMMQVTGEIMPLIKEPETGKGETETKKRTASSRKSMRSK